MAKKGAAKQKASTNRVSDVDRERYGEVIDAFRSTFDEFQLGIAADIVGHGAARRAIAAFSGLSLLGVIYGLAANPQNQLIAPVALVLAVTSSAIASQWPSIMKWRLRKTNLGAQVLDGDQRVVVCPDSLHIEHGSTVEDLPLSSLKSVRADNEALLAEFSDKRYVLVPKSALGETRFKALAELLRR